MILNCLVLAVEDVVVEGGLDFVFTKAKFEVKNFPQLDSRWISLSEQIPV